MNTNKILAFITLHHLSQPNHIMSHKHRRLNNIGNEKKSYFTIIKIKSIHTPLSVDIGIVDSYNKSLKIKLKQIYSTGDKRTVHIRQHYSGSSGQSLGLWRNHTQAAHERKDDLQRLKNLLVSIGEWWWIGREGWMVKNVQFLECRRLHQVNTFKVCSSSLKVLQKQVSSIHSNRQKSSVLIVVWGFKSWDNVKLFQCHYDFWKGFQIFAWRFSRWDITAMFFSLPSADKRSIWHWTLKWIQTYDRALMNVPITHEGGLCVAKLKSSESQQSHPLMSGSATVSEGTAVTALPLPGLWLFHCSVLFSTLSTAAPDPPDSQLREEIPELLKLETVLSRKSSYLLPDDFTDFEMKKT